VLWSARVGPQHASCACKLGKIPAFKAASGPPKTCAKGRFCVQELLAEGTYAKVYGGTDVRTGARVAVKVQTVEPGSSRGSYQSEGILRNEVFLLELIGRPGPPPHGIPHVHGFSTEGPHCCLVIDLLGRNLEECKEACGGTFNLSTTALVAEQLIRVLAFVHSRGVVHRDVKPENFMCGLGPRRHIVHIVDFGLSARYFTKSHALEKRGHVMHGTARYMSKHAHAGWTQSRRDDLEAVGHMLVYFLRGSLPWSGLDDSDYGTLLCMIEEEKERLPVRDLCEGLPRELEMHLTYCRGLAFRQRPNYEFLSGLFAGLCGKLGPLDDHQLQWLELDGGPLVPGSLEQIRRGEIPTQPDEDGAPALGTTSMDTE